MLAKFCVRNFRNFKDWFIFDFTTSKNYEFNSYAIENQIVKHGMIYAVNGGGKSNLGLAMLDITSHLRDEIKLITSLSDNYLNANSSERIAEFKYFFKFQESLVEYSYGKSDRQTVVYENLVINGKPCISIDRRISDKATFDMAGTESLKTDLSNSTISAVKYLNSNAILDDDEINIVFNKFIKFISGMVFFRTLKDTTESQGQVVSVKRISQAIIEKKKLIDFEEFLNEAGVSCRLRSSGIDEDEIIEFVFDNKCIEFSRAASTGTMSLGIFYYWWMQISSNDLTFAYIDEFDAYYHQKLSQALVKKISEVNCQTILTSHNTSIMSNDILRPDCYFELRDKQYPLCSLVDKDLRKAHNLEKIYKGLFDE